MHVRLARPLAAALVACALLYACGGGSSPPPDDPARPVRFFAYVANNTNTVGSVSAYTIDGNSGALSAVPGSPFASGANPNSITVANSAGAARFAYVSNSASGNISGYSVNATTGALTALTGSLFPAAGAGLPRALAAHPSGN